VRIACPEQVLHSGESPEPTLHVAVPWGTEFGVKDLKTDIATIKLVQRANNKHFLGAVFNRIQKSRATLAKSRSKVQKLKLEVEDLAVAKQYFQKAQTEDSKHKRMQAFADTINAYKLLCREASRHSQPKP